MSLYARLTEGLPSLVLRHEEPLSAHTSFRIGGPAEMMAFPHSVEELSAVLRIAKEEGTQPLLLGAGTNVLAPDEGVRGLVIVTREAMTGLRQNGPGEIVAEAGVTMARLAAFARDCGLTGLEFAHGIPGTVGGGVYMNAGAYGGEIGQVAVRTEELLPDGILVERVGEAQGFSYRSSAFQNSGGVIVRTVFALQAGNPEKIRARMQELMEKRRASQPLELPSAGSTFKRPQGGYAAALIEQAGLKGITVGGAAVSEKHAGFIVNRGSATAADVLALVKLVQERVLESSGIQLEPEVRLWGNV